MSSKWLNQADKIILKTGQFSQCLALNKTLAVPFNKGQTHELLCANVLL